MILAEEVQATGTACSGLNIWPLGAIWQPRSVRFVSGALCHDFCNLKLEKWFSLKFSSIEMMLVAWLI